MAKKKRFTPRTQSAPVQVPDNAQNMTQSASHVSPQSDPLDDLDPSFDFENFLDNEDGSFVPTDQKKPNKCWPVNVIVGDGEPKEERLRVKDLFSFPSEKKVILDWNREGQPIGYAAGLLGGYLGAIGASYDILPISYVRWPKVPNDLKTDVWNKMIKKVFLLDECRKKFILGSIGKKWKDTRCLLFNEFYDDTRSWEQNLEFRPDGIPKDQWASFLEYRLSTETMEICEINRENRAKQTTTHTLGSKTYARKRHELETQTGRSFGRVEMYDVAHKKKDGSFVTQEAKEKSERLNERALTSSGEDIYVEVFGKEHPGRMRGMGYGVTPTQYLSSGSCNGSSMSAGVPTAADYARLNSELQASNARVQALETEVAKVRTLEEQVAFLMQQAGGQMQQCPARSNQVADLRSPAEAIPSSSASHVPAHRGPASSL